MRHALKRATGAAQKKLVVLKRLPPGECAGIGFAPGHAGFTTCREVAEKLQGDVIILTMLREPVARVVSQFSFLKGSIGWFQRRSDGRIPWLHDVPDMSIEECLADPRMTWIRNQQTHLLASGPDGMWNAGDRTVGQSDPAVLEAALANLQQTAAGLTERFDESLLLFASQFGWRPPLYLPANRTSVTFEVTDHQRQLIRQANNMDVALYQHATQLFADRLAADGTVTPARLNRFRRANRWFRFSQRVRAQLQRIARRCRLTRPSPTADE